MKTFLISLLIVSSPCAAKQGFNPRDVARVIAAPTDTNCEAFDAKYGNGATALILSKRRR